MIRWLIVLVLTVAAAFFLWRSFGVWQDYQRVEAQRESTQNQLTVLLAQERELLAQKKRIEEWNELWAKAQAAGIDPGRWIVNPIHTKQDLPWPELEKLLSFVSSSHPMTTGMWIKPEALSVSRIRSQSEGEGEGQAVQDEGASGSDMQEGPTLFTVRIQGEFLIPKKFREGGSPEGS